MSRRWKTVIQLLLIFFWLGMMFTLIKGRLLPRREEVSVTLIDPSTLVEKWRNYEEWMRLYWQTTPIGAFHTCLEKLKQADGYLGCVRFVVAINLGRINRQMLFSSVALLDPNFALSSFIVDTKLDKLQWRMKGLVKGKKLYYKIEREEEAAVGIINLEKTPTLLDSAGNILARDLRLEVGKTYKLPVFDPVWSFEAGEVEISVSEFKEIEINHKPFNAYRLDARLGQVVITTWLDTEGQVLKRELPNKIMMVRASEEEIVKEFPQLGQPVSLPAISPEEFQAPSTSPAEEGVLSKLTKIFSP